LAGFVVVSGAFAFVHGRSFLANLGVVHWEDRLFFTYVEGHVHGLWDCFTQPGPWPGLYRPISTNVYYFVAGFFTGTRVEPLHIFNACLILLNGLLLMRLSSAFMRPVWATLAAALWCSRLAMTEVVRHTCEVQGLLSVTFGLLSMLVLARGARSSRPRDAILSGALLLLALLSKETAVSFALLALAWLRLGWPETGSRRTSLGIVPVSATALWGLAFLLWRDTTAGHSETGFHYDFTLQHVLGGFATHLLDYSNGLVRAGHNTIMPETARVPAESASAALGMGLLMAGLAGCLIRPRIVPAVLRPAILGLVLFVAAVLPYAPLSGRLFMRYSYLGHAGLSLALGGLAQAAWMASRRFRGAVNDLTPPATAPART
jgi:hypothetical protein